MSARAFVASNGGTISIGTGSTITVNGNDAKVSDVDATGRLEVVGNVTATVNGQPVAVVSEGPVPRASTVPLGIQAARAQAAAKYRQMKQQQQQQQKEQAGTEAVKAVSKQNAKPIDKAKEKEKQKEKEKRVLSMGKGMRAKIDMDGPFHPGTVRKLTAEELKAQPEFKRTSLMDGREVEGITTKAVCAGNTPQHGKFRVRVGQNVYQVEWNHCYASSEKGFFVDGVEYLMP